MTMPLQKLVFRTSLIFLLATLLASCGFHLRGNIPLPQAIQNMHVKGPAGTFKDKLEEVLTNAGATINENAAGADVILNVRKAVTDRKVGTLDDRGKADSYDLEFKVTYRVEDLEGKEVRRADLKESRRYSFDPDQVVESESEEADLQLDMEESIALRIVRQLASLTNYSPGQGNVEAK